ncbi:HNH endonuclease [Aerosakkonemataceae cyanobacterium BLCC-F154]|uniref:HNH endonuclease n=1 Tax=Floridaenema fluviatile BLCC-F154 TaxID=3153640 RepID=A0ABV4YJ18_9CYAN
MSAIPVSLRRLVIQRADNRCEYCKISQIGQVATFHIDHIVPVVAGGETTAENLALACVSCSLRKGARQTIVDSETGEVVSIFNPRQQLWKEHFDWNGVQIVGLTAIGRATIQALDLNRSTMLA